MKNRSDCLRTGKKWTRLSGKKETKNLQQSFLLPMYLKKRENVVVSDLLEEVEEGQ